MARRIKLQLSTQSHMKRVFLSLSAAALLSSCSTTTPTAEQTAISTAPLSENIAVPSAETEFLTATGQFADLRILRYQVPGFAALLRKQKELL